jgi:class 3 adenylate cyclase
VIAAYVLISTYLMAACGEVDIADDSVSGIAVDIATRLAALARAGEVLASRTVKDLVAGSGISFTDAALTSCLTSPISGQSSPSEMGTSPELRTTGRTAMPAATAAERVGPPRTRRRDEAEAAPIAPA